MIEKIFNCGDLLLYVYVFWCELELHVLQVVKFTKLTPVKICRIHTTNPVSSFGDKNRQCANSFECDCKFRLLKIGIHLSSITFFAFFKLHASTPLRISRYWIIDIYVTAFDLVYFHSCGSGAREFSAVTLALARWNVPTVSSQTGHSCVQINSEREMSKPSKTLHTASSFHSPATGHAEFEKSTLYGVQYPCP